MGLCSKRALEGFTAGTNHHGYTRGPFNLLESRIIPISYFDLSNTASLSRHRLSEMSDCGVNQF
jgi:hypothetical protein